MRVIFIGINNKPGLPPLCGSTKTGKIVNKIIALRPKDTEVLKTNLFNTTEFPQEYDTRREFAMDWLVRANPQKDDIIILLGRTVQENFIKTECSNLINTVHPSSLYGNENIEKFINEVSEKINELT